MLRNTGAHPFNSEPPLKHLQEAGWITPHSLHVVRNHGAVPQLSWSEHRLTITGVPKPVELSMDQIVSGEWGSVASIPVTFICAGNRRKEQNMTKKTVSDKPSENHYHYFDNRVLPPHVDADLAHAEGWWFKPEYIINHMNINSAMFEPRHNSFVRDEKPPKTVKVSGYAYTGGGNKIIRAEISLDSGKSWEITELSRPEDEIAEARGTDKHWCWAWWETEVDMSRLLDRDCEEICCRAWDSNQNCQPVQLTWTVMGMLNNPIYRIKIHRENGMLWFEHPTQGSMPGGWMTDQAGKFNDTFALEATPGKNGVAPFRPVAATWKGAKIDAVNAASPDANAASVGEVKPTKAGKLVQSTDEWLKGITMDEVKKHDNEESCWFVVKGNVYDGTPYLKDHPGGASSILLAGGLEATEDFEAVHSTRAWEMLKDYYMGPLKSEGPDGPGLLSQLWTGFWQHLAAPLSLLPLGPAVFLNPRESQQLHLSEKIVVNHDTRIFRFKLPSPSMKLGLPTGMHMTLKAKVDGKPVMRAYTPMTDDNTLGHVDLLVKVYFKGVHPAFPEGGKMSQHLDSMEIGDAIDVKGPIGEFEYLGHGQCKVNGKSRFVTEISMIAGGTGITPCYQVLAAILRDPDDTTRVRLLFANRTPDDILARNILEELASKHPDRFKLSLTVDKLPSEDSEDKNGNSSDSKNEWKGHVGFVNTAMAKASLFDPSDSGVCVMCGPPVMLEKACYPALHAMGYEDANIFCF
eukprot:Skav201772  [mRNA]  locus=scaffold2375:29483:33783:- [translate_table: standard]